MCACILVVAFGCCFAILCFNVVSVFRYVFVLLSCYSGCLCLLWILSGGCFLCVWCCCDVLCVSVVSVSLCACCVCVLFCVIAF